MLKAMTDNPAPATSVSRTGPETARLPAADLVDPPSTGRLIGLDLARGLAVFGMYSAHVGPDVTVGGPVGFLLELARGRSSALFALLAGFSLVILTGRPHARTGRAGRQAVARVVIRAVVLVALGFALTALDTQVDVILAYYGLIFLAVLPLYRLPARTLAVIAAAGALILPQLLYAVRQAIDEGSWADTVVAWDPLARLTGSEGFLELLVTGEYPVVTWVPFLVAGMAVARLDLHRAGARARLALTGGALAVFGHGGSWLALHAVPGALAAVAAATDAGSASSAWWSDTAGEPVDGVPLAWQLVAVPHSQTTFSILGSTGVALLVLAGCLALADRAPQLARAATPVSAVGMVALTVYVLHIVALWTFAEVWTVVDVENDTMSALPILLGFIAAAVLLATVWTRVFRRGPLEYLLHKVTGLARHVT